MPFNHAEQSMCVFSGFAAVVAAASDSERLGRDQPIAQKAVK